MVAASVVTSATLGDAVRLVIIGASASLDEVIVTPPLVAPASVTLMDWLSNMSYTKLEFIE